MEEGLEKVVQRIIESGKGDTDRLNHILNTIRKKKPLFMSDQKYLNSLLSSIQSNTKIQETIQNENNLDLKEEVKQLKEKIEKISKEQSSIYVSTAKLRQYKSVGITTVLSIILGLIGIWGMGHFYIGEKRRGIAFLVTGLFLIIWMIVLIAGFTYWTDGNIETPEQFITILAVELVLGIPFTVLYVIQIISAIRSCKKHNRLLDQIGRL